MTISSSIFHLIVALALLLAFSHLGGSALAEDATDDIEFDEYSALSEQVLMLRGDVSSPASEAILKQILYVHGFYRFNTSIMATDPNNDAVREWCISAVKGTQIRRDQLDSNFEPEITQRAVEERCSDVYKYDLWIRGNCNTSQDLSGNTKESCKLKVRSLKIYKYRAIVNHGIIRWIPDSSFGIDGIVEIKEEEADYKVVYDSNGRVVNPLRQATNALSSTAGLRARRAIRKIKLFQAHAPILAAKSGKAYSCLGRDTVDLDTPFVVVFDNQGTQVRKGFVKARKIFDGCHMTPLLASDPTTRSSVKLKPLEAQIILGSADVKAGYTIWEIPSIGLNIGGGAAFGQSMVGVGLGGFKMWVLPFAHAEFNLAPFIGVSEFHLFGTLKVSAGLDNEFNEMLEDKYSSYGFDLHDAVDMIVQFDVGVMKRWFIRAFIVGIGIGANVGLYTPMLSLPGEYSISAIGVGANARIEIGFQLTPRLLTSLTAGYRLEAGISSLSRNRESVEPEKYLGLFHAPTAAISFNYSF